MIRFQIQDQNGEVIEESNLEIRDGDVIIYHFNDERLYREYVRNPKMSEYVTSQLKSALKKPGGILVLPPGIDIKVLRLEEGNR